MRVVDFKLMPKELIAVIRNLGSQTWLTWLGTGENGQNMLISILEALEDTVGKTKSL